MENSPDTVPAIAAPRVDFDRAVLRSAVLRLGSLTCKIYFDDAYQQYAEFLAASFRVSLEPTSSVADKEIEIEIVFVEDSRQVREDFAALAECTSTLIPFDGGITIGTDITVGYLLTNCTPSVVLAPIVNSGFAYPEMIAFLLALVYRVLLVLDRIPLHGAAIRFNDSTSLFIGGNGAGKTTISLTLARLGGIILGEDHILVRHEGSGFTVSGMDKIARVTAKTERYIFSELLPLEVREFGGVQKKELQLAEFFGNQPYVDAPIRRMFFNHVGTQFRVQPMTTHSVFLNVVSWTKEMYRLRLPHSHDFSRYFTLVKKIAESVPAFDLELSPDLADLDKLPDYLR